MKRLGRRDYDARWSDHLGRILAIRRAPEGGLFFAIIDEEGACYEATKDQCREIAEMITDYTYHPRHRRDHE